MLYFLAAVLVIVWLAGVIISYTLLGFIHILLIIAIILVMMRFISGHKKQTIEKTK